MPTLWDAIRATLSATDRAAEPCSVLTGQETDEELRELALRFSQQCPIGELSRHCPFYLLNGLHYATAKDIVDKMSRQSLLEMFDEERQCRKKHSDECFKSVVKRPSGI